MGRIVKCEMGKERLPQSEGNDGFLCCQVLPFQSVSAHQRYPKLQRRGYETEIGRSREKRVYLYLEV